MPLLSRCILMSMLLLFGATAIAQQDPAKPNILIIWGDDIGMWNISAYSRGLMAGQGQH